MVLFSHLHLGGGGMLGLVYLGALRCIQKQSACRHIHHVSGISIGAFFGCLFAMNADMDDVVRYMRDVWREDSARSIPAESIVEWMHVYGIDTLDRMIDILRHFYRLKYAHATASVSFAEFSKTTGKTLTVCATSLADHVPEYFSIDRTPDVCVFEAVRASMCIPLIIKPVVINGKVYVDGALTCDFPKLIFEESDANRVLSLFLSGAKDVKDANGQAPLSNMFSYITHLFTCMMHPKALRHVARRFPFTFVLRNIPLAFIPLKFTEECFIIDVTPEKLSNAYQYGYGNMNQYMKRNNIT